jgi:ribosomal protein S18 acetylase RimI-like enzyme
MQNKISLLINVPDESNQAVLRAANRLDLLNLRNWKNAQRAFFFHTEEITEGQQQAWFDTYQSRPQDYMLIVDVNGRAIGCMGIRLLEAEWDVYNVIVGDAIYAKKGYMGKAFQAMLAFAASQTLRPITLKVLKHNPAVSWYQKQGFEITAEQLDHFQMSFKTQSKKENAL